MGLVKETRNISEHPGYEYKRFSSFGEVNEYFSSIYGEHWTELAWAKHWLYEENKEKKPRSKKKQHRNSGIKERIRAIYEQYGYGISKYAVHGHLIALGVKISRDSANRYCNIILAEKNNGDR